VLDAVGSGRDRLPQVRACRHMDQDLLARAVCGLDDRLERGQGNPLAAPGLSVKDAFDEVDLIEQFLDLTMCLVDTPHFDGHGTLAVERQGPALDTGEDRSGEEQRCRGAAGPAGLTDRAALRDRAPEVTHRRDAGVQIVGHGPLDVRQPLGFRQGHGEPGQVSVALPQTWQQVAAASVQNHFAVVAARRRGGVRGGGTDVLESPVGDADVHGGQAGTAGAVDDGHVLDDHGRFPSMVLIKDCARWRTTEVR